MKTKLILNLAIFMIALTTFTSLKAQETMYIHKHDGTVIEFLLSSVEYLTFDKSTNLAMQTELLTRFMEAKAYPNPSRDVVNIKYNISTEGKVIIQMVNSEGRKIKDFSPGWLTAGEYDFRWETGNMPAGLYILRIIQNNQSVTEKIIINH